MKEMLTRNISLKILAIILAALLWLVITNVEDPIITGNFHNVPVTILNEKKIKSLDQTYQIIEGKTIDITFTARRKVKEELSVSNFRATADLSNLTELNTVNINISCPGHEGDVTIKNSSNQVLKVEREQLAEDQFQVNVKTTGEPAEGYYVAKKSATTLITVSGPKSKIDRIASVVVEVDVSGSEASFRTNEVPKAYDKEGNEIDPTNIKYSVSLVPINIVMYPTKEIDLLIVTSGKPADGYVMTAMEYQPTKIEIAGNYPDLNNIQSLTVTEYIDGATQDIVKDISLQEYLGNGLILAGDNQTVTINITIEPAVKKTVTIQPGDLEKRNLPADLDLAYLSSSSIVLNLSGPAGEMDKLTDKSITPFIDVSNFSSGTYNVVINAEMPEYVTLVNNPSINIYLKTKK